MQKFKKVAIIIVGWVFIFLGILGIFLPFLQGILFIMIGLAILSSRSELIRRFLNSLEERYPKQYEKVKSWREKIIALFKKD